MTDPNTQPDAAATDFTQAEEFIINDLDALKVVADPLRLQIIELIFDHAHTVKQIAKKLKLPPSKLYYHINLLEKHGLITIASTRIVSGIVEKSYQASAANIRVRKGLLSPGRAPSEEENGVGMLVTAILDDARQDILENAAAGLVDLSGEEHPHSLRISRSTTRFTEEEALEFQQRLQDIVEEFRARREETVNIDEQGYAFVFAFYPTARGSRPADTDED
jgi:DNA-binding transcriptional ArsR family regulator